MGRGGGLDPAEVLRGVDLDEEEGWRPREVGGEERKEAWRRRHG